MQLTAKLKLRSEPEYQEFPSDAIRSRAWKLFRRSRAGREITQLAD